MSGDIPLGVWREILVRLPAVSLFRLRAICKGWRDVIDDPCFVRAHTNKHQLSSNIIIRNSTGLPFYPLYYLDFESINFSSGSQTVDVTPLNLNPGELSSLPVVSCNGLMLIAPVIRDKCFWTGEVLVYWDPKGIWEIMNPITHERLRLPGPKSKSHVMCIGLGYDRVADDYKVVAIENWRAHVYSLKSVSWKKIGKCPFDYRSSSCGGGVFLNGVLHWLLSDDGVILGLDVATEKYSQLALPCFERRPRKSMMQLDVLSGCLFLSFSYYDRNCNEYFDVWMMNDYGKEDSWMKLFTLKKGHLSYNPFSEETREVDYHYCGTRLPNYHVRRLVAYMKNKRLALVQDDNRFVLFDIESDSIKLVEIHGVCTKTSRVSAQTCVGSLFRLRCGCVQSVVPAVDHERRRKMKTADSKLTFCVRDYNTNRDGRRLACSHDDCYSNWHNSSSSQVCVSSSFNPDSSLSVVPLDICREIFLLLPVKTLIRFRDVCKPWRSVIDDPCFVKAYDTKKQLTSHTLVIRNSTGPPFHPLYSFDFNGLSFTQEGLQSIPATPLGFTYSGLSCLPSLPMAVCNGLMLIAPKKPKKEWDNEISWDPEGTWEIWNLSTHERFELPRVKFSDNPKEGAIGIGYDKTTDDYKAVVISLGKHHKTSVRKHHKRSVRILHKRSVLRTHVYSLKSDSWRKVGNCPLYVGDWRGTKAPVGPGVFLCGALHWLQFDFGSDNNIIALDLGTKKYQLLQMRPLDKTSGLSWMNLFLDVLDGCLILTCIADNNQNHDRQFDMWVMKDYGDADSWFKLFSIGNDDLMMIYYLRPVAYLKDKMQVFLQDDRFKFYLFDIESDSLKRVFIHGLTGNMYAQIIPGSIFRLHDNCGVSGGRKRRMMRTTSETVSADTEFLFCLRDIAKYSNRNADPHDSCYSPNSSFYISSGEEDEDRSHCSCYKLEEEEEECSSDESENFGKLDWLAI